MELSLAVYRTTAKLDRETVVDLVHNDRDRMCYTPMCRAVWNKSGSSRSEANRRKTRLKFHGVAVFVRSQEADIYSKIVTRHTINDKYSNSLLSWSF